MAASKNTRQQILATAEELLLRRGFQGFSYHHIAERLGIRNAAVHYYFPAKADLGLALIRRHHEHFRWWAWQLHKQKATPSDALERFFATERRFLEQGSVCPLSVITVELEGVSPAMRTETQRLLGDVASWLADMLELGRRSGELSFRGSSRDRAMGMLAALQGALQLARLGGQELFEQILAMLRHDCGLPATRTSAARAAG